MKLYPAETHGRRQGFEAGGRNSKGLAEGKSWFFWLQGPRDTLRLAPGKEGRNQ